MCLSVWIRTPRKCETSRSICLPLCSMLPALWGVIIRRRSITICMGSEVYTPAIIQFPKLQIRLEPAKWSLAYIPAAKKDKVVDTIALVRSVTETFKIMTCLRFAHRTHTLFPDDTIPHKNGIHWRWNILMPSCTDCLWTHRGKRIWNGLLQLRSVRGLLRWSRQKHWLYAVTLLKNILIDI